jgi:transposase
MPLLFESRGMSIMAKKIDPELRARAVRLVNDHLGEYQNVTAVSVAVANQLGVPPARASRPRSGLRDADG